MALSRRSTPLLVAGGLLAGGVIAAAALNATGALADPSTPRQSHGYGQQPGAPGESGGQGGQGPRPGMMGRAFGFGGPGRAGRGGLGGDMLHGEIVVKTAAGTETELVQRGDVTANAGGTVTVRSSDNFTVTWTIGSSTSIRSGRDTGTVKDLAVGDEVTAVGTKTSDGGAARFIAERPTAGAGTHRAPTTKTPTAKTPVGSA